MFHGTRSAFVFLRARVFCALPLSICRRRFSRFLLKDAAEIGNAAEAAALADLGDRHGFLYQHVFCQNDTGLQYVIHDRHARAFLEFSAEIVFAHMYGVTDLINGNIG